jgi:hypothetical protein
VHIGQLADAGGDGVGDAIVFDKVFNDLACAIDGQACLGFQQYGTALVNHLADVIKGEIVSVDMKGLQKE